LRLAVAIIAGVALGVVLTGGVVIGAMIYFEYPGGMRGSYPAVDGDRRLTAVAREATPMIGAVDAFYAAHRACPRPNEPDELAEFRAKLPAGMTAAVQGRFVSIQGKGMELYWLYDVSEPEPRSCTLWRKLGWDRALIWSRGPGGAHWVFDPGDGSDERPVALDP
jgi:hypothetical protein